MGSSTATLNQRAAPSSHPLGSAQYSDVSEPARTLATADHGAAVTAQADPSSTTPRVRQEPATREEALKPRSFISKARTRCEEARETRKKTRGIMPRFPNDGNTRPPSGSRGVVTIP